MKTKLTNVIILMGGFLGHGAMAGSLSGLYNVASCEGNVLQVGTTEKIEASSAAFSQSLDMEGQVGTGDSRYSPVLTAAIGDVIRRPTPDIVKLGYTTVDRQITAYNASGDMLVFNEYVYDMSLTDDQGLAAGPYKTVVFKTYDQGITYDLKFSDGEKYRCVLVRK